MHCRFCGKEIKDQAKFCGFCGNPQDFAKKSDAKKHLNILGCVFGLLFILGGILPYLLQGGTAAYQDYINHVFSSNTGYPAEITVVTISCFQKFTGFLSPLFSFSSSALAVYVGLLLIRRDSGLKLPVVSCIAVQLLSVVYNGVINLLTSSFPGFVVSLFAPDPTTIVKCQELIRSEPDLLYYYQDLAIYRLIFSIILLILSVNLPVIQKRSVSGLTNDGKKATSIGAVLIIPAVSLLSVLGAAFTDSFVASQGNYALAAYSSANSAYTQLIGPAVFYLFLILMAVGMVFTRTKRWILVLPTISVIVLLALGVCLFTRTLLQDFYVSEQLFPMTASYFRGFVINSAAVLVAIFCWFSSLSRNRIPRWLQIALPVSLPFLYIGAQILAGSAMHLNAGISFGILLISFITTILSLLVRPRAGTDPKTAI